MRSVTPPGRSCYYPHFTGDKTQASRRGRDLPKITPMGLTCKPVFISQHLSPLKFREYCLAPNFHDYRQMSHVFSHCPKAERPVTYLEDDDLSGPLCCVLASKWVRQRPLEGDCVPQSLSASHSAPWEWTYSGFNTVFNCTSLEVCPSLPSHPKWRKNITPLLNSRPPSLMASASRRA